MLVEQIFYTATYEDKKHGLGGGYAVVAKSEGIDDKILNFLELYHYPLGASNHSFFDNYPYKSLLEFKNKLIYTVARTSLGFDGRSGTYSTNHFVFNKKEFIDINNDTRRLDRFAGLFDHTIRWLPLLVIEPCDELGNLRQKIDSTLYSIIVDLKKGKRVALLHRNDQVVRIQDIISQLRIEDRIIPFTNYLYEPGRQTGFKFVAGDHQLSIALRDKRWEKYEISAHLDAHEID